jgi:hypothetical protein
MLSAKSSLMISPLTDFQVFYKAVIPEVSGAVNLRFVQIVKPRTGCLRTILVKGRANLHSYSRVNEAMFNHQRLMKS